MKLFDALYYQYYLYSKRFLKDEEPFWMANWVLSCVLAFFLNGVVAFVAAKFFCLEVGKWFMVFLTMVILLAGYLYFNRSGRARMIISAKPLLFSNAKASTIFAILFLLISISWLFWGAVYWPKCDQV